MKKFFQNAGRILTRPILTLGGAFGGQELGRFLIPYAPRIANQLPLAGFILGGLGGLKLGDLLLARQTGLSVSIVGDIVVAHDGSGMVRTESGTFNVGEIQKATGAWKRGVSILSDDELDALIADARGSESMPLSEKEATSKAKVSGNGILVNDED